MSLKQIKLATTAVSPPAVLECEALEPNRLVNIRPMFNININIVFNCADVAETYHKRQPSVPHLELHGLVERTHQSLAGGRPYFP